MRAVVLPLLVLSAVAAIVSGEIVRTVTRENCTASALSDADCLSRAIGECSSGDTLEISAGTWVLKSTVLIPAGVDLVISGPQFGSEAIVQVETAEGEPAFGTEVDAVVTRVPLLHDANPRVASIASSDNASAMLVKQGYLLVLESAASWAEQDDPELKCAEVIPAKEDGTAEGTVRLDGTIFGQYAAPAGEAQFSAVRPATVSIRRLTFRGDAGRRSPAILLHGVSRSGVEDCIFEGFKGDAIVVKLSYMVDVTRCDFSDIEGTSVVLDDATTAASVSSCDFMQTRTCLETRHSSHVGQHTKVLFKENKVVDLKDQTAAVVDSGADCNDLQVVGCEVSGMPPKAALVSEGATMALVQNNDVTGSGTLWRSTVLRASEYIDISNNTLHGVAAVDQLETAVVRGILAMYVRHNHVVGSRAVFSLTVGSAVTLNVVSNVADNCSEGVRVVIADAKNRPTITVGHNTIRGSAGTAVWIEAVNPDMFDTALTVSENFIEDSNRKNQTTVKDMYAVALKGVCQATLQCNRILEETVPISGTGVAELEGCDRNAVSHNRIVGMLISFVELVGTGSSKDNSDANFSGSGCDWEERTSSSTASSPLSESVVSSFSASSSPFLDPRNVSIIFQMFPNIFTTAEEVLTDVATLLEEDVSVFTWYSYVTAPVDENGEVTYTFTATMPLSLGQMLEHLHEEGPFYGTFTQYIIGVEVLRPNLPASSSHSSEIPSDLPSGSSVLASSSIAASSSSLSSVPSSSMASSSDVPIIELATVDVSFRFDEGADIEAQAVIDDLAAALGVSNTELDDYMIVNKSAAVYTAQIVMKLDLAHLLKALYNEKKLNGPYTRFVIGVFVEDDVSTSQSQSSSVPESVSESVPVSESSQSETPDTSPSSGADNTPVLAFILLECPAGVCNDTEIVLADLAGSLGVSVDVITFHNLTRSNNAVSTKRQVEAFELMITVPRYLFYRMNELLDSHAFSGEVTSCIKNIIEVFPPNTSSSPVKSSSSPDKEIVPNDKGKGLTTAEIVLLVIAGFVVVLAVTAVIVAYFWNKKHPKSSRHQETTDAEVDTGKTALLGMESIA